MGPCTPNIQMRSYTCPPPNHHIKQIHMRPVPQPDSAVTLSTSDKTHMVRRLHLRLTTHPCTSDTQMRPLHFSQTQIGPLKYEPCTSVLPFRCGPAPQILRCARFTSDRLAQIFVFTHLICFHIRLSYTRLI